MISMFGTVFAVESDDHTGDNIVAVENGNFKPVSNGYNIIEGETLQLNLKARKTLSVSSDIFSDKNSVTEEDDINFYVVYLPTPRASALKIVSSNTNMIARICTLDVDKNELKITNAYALASESEPYIEGNMDAGYYALAVYSLDSSTPAGSYTLMWNSSNPGGASLIVEYARPCLKNAVRIVKVTKS